MQAVDISNNVSQLLNNTLLQLFLCTDLQNYVTKLRMPFLLTTKILYCNMVIHSMWIYGKQVILQNLAVTLDRVACLQCSLIVWPIECLYCVGCS